MVTPAGFEPAIFWMRTRYPEPLDDGALTDVIVANFKGAPKPGSSGLGRRATIQDPAKFGSLD